MPQLSSILLVEDNPHDQKLIQRTLSQQLPRSHVALAPNGRAALTALANHPYDVVLLDFQLNDMSGLEIFHEMQARGTCPATIIITGQGNEKVAVEAIQAGAQNYLVKDIASDYLNNLPTAVWQAFNQWHDQQARQRAEHALSNSEETLRATFTSMDDLVFVLDKSGICIVCYKPLKFEIKTVWPESTIIGSHYRDVFPPSLAQPLQTILKLVEQSQTTEAFDFELATEAAHFWFNARVSPRLNQQQQYDGVTVVARDITARKQAQRQLEKQYQRQSALAELELAINQTHELEALLGKIVLIVADLLPATGGSSIILWDAATESYSVSASTVPQQQAQAGKNRVRKKGGATRWIIDHQQPVIVTNVANDPFTANKLLTDYDIHAYVGVPLLADGIVMGVLYGMHLSPRDYPASDIDFLSRLGHRAALAIQKVQTYTALQQQKNDLAIQNAELEAFSSTVAHDLKSPLATINGFADLLLTGENFPPDSEGHQFLTIINKNSLRMARIIDELLLLAHVRQQDVELTPVAMRPVIQESMARLQFMIDETHPQIICPEEWPAASGYAPWLEEVWTNYISNAIKYGGPRAHIELGATLRPDNQVKFWVQDKGPGIPDDKQAILFTPFTQLSQSRGKGHGLGLSIVQRIIFKCGGQVGVESELGEGSRFWFTLAAPA